MLVELDEDTMIRFAEIGLVTTLRTAADRVLAENEQDDEG